MGCDIHVHIEVKMEGKWRHYSAPNVRRNYNLFALMAGVRNYENITPVSEPKGLPEDITYITRKHYEDYESFAHDESWLGVEELIELNERQKELNLVYIPDHLRSFFFSETFGGFLFGNSFTGWYKYPEDNRMGIEDVRFVFWFDN